MQKLLTLSEKISKYLVAAVLIIVPLLPKFPLVKVPGTYVAIRFEDILMLLLGVILIPKFIVDFKSIWKNKIFNAFLIFFAVTFVSLIAGAFVSQTVELRLAFLHWARRVEYAIPFFATYLLIPRNKIRESAEFYFKILLIVVAVAFLYGIGERYFRFPVIITQNDQYSKGIALRWTPGTHINATFAGHYDLSAFIVLVMPILLGALFTVKGKLTKLFAAVSSGAGLWLLINSVSRTAQATYLLAITVTFLLLKKFKVWVIVALISVIAMALSSGLDARFERAIKVLYEHVTSGKSFSYVSGFVVRADEVTLSPRSVDFATPTPAPSSVSVINDVSIAIRINVEWPRAIRAFLINPILGTGYSSIGLATDNDYLRMLGEVGILGFAAFVLIFLRIGKVLIKIFSVRDRLDNFEKSFVFGMIGGLSGTLATALLIDLFEASKFAIVFWLLLGCSVSLIENKINDN
jgi:hypothetical protein